jgi:hypothetical protein
MAWATSLSWYRVGAIGVLVFFEGTVLNIPLVRKHTLLGSVGEIYIQCGRPCPYFSASVLVSIAVVVMKRKMRVMWLYGDNSFVSTEEECITRADSPQIELCAGLVPPLLMADLSVYSIASLTE